MISVIMVHLLTVMVHLLSWQRYSGLQATAKYYVSLSYCVDRAMDRATVSATYAIDCL